MDRYEIVATGLIVLIPLLTAVLLVVGVVWAYDSHRTHPSKATVGILMTTVALGNLFVQQDLGPASTRPVIALFVEKGAAFEGALGCVAAVLLLAVATSVAVRLPAPAAAKTATR